MARTPTTQRMVRNYTLGMPVDLLDACINRAAWEGRSLSWIMRTLLREWMADAPSQWLGSSDAGRLIPWERQERQRRKREAPTGA